MTHHKAIAVARSRLATRGNKRLLATALVVSMVIELPRTGR
jgi:hypothetical protein